MFREYVRRMHALGQSIIFLFQGNLLLNRLEASRADLFVYSLLSSSIMHAYF